MGIDWQDCIVTHFDLVDAKRGASTGQASERMRRFHRVVVRELKYRSLPSIVHTYTWNDSALIVSKVNKSPASFCQALRDLHGFKKSMDILYPCFAIAVKGQTFPWNERGENERVTVSTTGLELGNG